MTSILSFSLWGDKPVYLRGAVENAKDAPRFYPGWTCRFYVDSAVPETLTDELKSHGAQVVRVVNDRGPFYGMYWRFFPMDDLDLAVMVSRDCDSRLTYREVAAVNVWLASYKVFHTMHDHPCHGTVPILGGMWGSRRIPNLNMKNLINGWNKYDAYGVDQEFLAKMLWPNVRHDCMRHVNLNCYAATRFGACVAFPAHLPTENACQYVGERFDANNKPVAA